MVRMTKKRDLYLSKTFFYTIGATLGDGVLTVPVEAARAGFFSYLSISIFPLIIEILSMVVYLQIYQKVRNHLTGELPPTETEKVFSTIPITEEEEEEEVRQVQPVVVFNEELSLKSSVSTKPLIDEGEKESVVNSSEEVVPIGTTALYKGLDLHTINSQYFHPAYTVLCDLVLFMNYFPHIYIVGLSQSFLSIFLGEKKIILWVHFLAPCLYVICIVVVALIGKRIASFVSFLSLIKSSLITIVVLLSMSFISSFTSTENFLLISRTWFIQTLMITGSLIFTPLMFSRLKPSKRNVILFTCSVALGLLASQIITYLWCFSVWGAVPQSDKGGKINLLDSLEKGELSNVPFILILREKGSSMAGVMAFFVGFFTSLTMTFSSLLWTELLKENLDGYVKDFATFLGRRRRNGQSVRRNVVFFRIFLYVLFGIITLVLTMLCCDFFYFFTEIYGYVICLAYALVLGGYVLVEIFRNPYSNVRIWFQIPGWLFKTIGVIVAVYFLTLSVYITIYEGLAVIYRIIGKTMPY